MTDPDQPPTVHHPRVVPPPRCLQEAVAAVSDPTLGLRGQDDHAGPGHDGRSPATPPISKREYASRPAGQSRGGPPPEPADDAPVKDQAAAWKTRARWYQRATAGVRNEQDREFVLKALRESFPALLAGLLEAQGIPADNAERLAAQIHPDRFITVDLELDVDTITSTALLLANPHRKDH